MSSSVAYKMPHFGKKALALADRYGPLEHCARLDIASGNPELVAYGERRLAMVMSARARQS